MFNLYAFFPSLAPILKWHEHIVVRGGLAGGLVEVGMRNASLACMLAPLLSFMSVTWNLHVISFAHLLTGMMTDCGLGYFGPVLFPQQQGSSSVLPGAFLRPWLCGDFPHYFPTLPFPISSPCWEAPSASTFHFLMGQMRASSVTQR